MSQLKGNSNLTSLTVDELSRISIAFKKSQAFKNGREPMTAEEIFVILVAGQEMGLGPSQAIMGIKMIEGKPSLSANLMASMVKASGKYDYRVAFGSDEDPWCEVIFYDTATGQDIGVSRFTPQMADEAGLRQPSRSGQPSNYLKYWRNMFFARALSNGTKWFVPDALMVSAYHDGELNGDTDAPVPDLPTQVAAGTSAQQTFTTTSAPSQITTGTTMTSPAVPRETEPVREPAVVPVAEPQPYDGPEEAPPTEMEQLIKEEEVDYFEPSTEPLPPAVEVPSSMFYDDDDEPAQEPTVTHESNEPVVSPAQVRLLHVRRKIAKLTDDRFKEILVQMCGTAHVDRVPKRTVNDLLERLDAEAKLAEQGG